jgi:hypothetical protein
VGAGLCLTSAGGVGRVGAGWVCVCASVVARMKLVLMRVPQGADIRSGVRCANTGTPKHIIFFFNTVRDAEMW